MDPSQTAEALIGMWRLVEHCNWDSNGAQFHQFGPEPVGYFFFDRGGHFCVQIMRLPPVRPFQAGPDAASPGELADVFRACYSAAGKFTVDAANSVIVCRAEASTRPELVGSDVSLPFRLEGGALIVGDGKTWHRLWVRVRM